MIATEIAMPNTVLVIYRVHYLITISFPAADGGYYCYSLLLLLLLQFTAITTSTHISPLQLVSAATAAAATATMALYTCIFVCVEVIMRTVQATFSFIH